MCLKHSHPSCLKVIKTVRLSSANIHPDLQHHVLDQVKKPVLVAADSMNLWIDIALDSLKKLLSRIDILIINDEEARMLTEEKNLTIAAAKILAMGPKRLIIKRGEYGVVMFSEDNIFMAPAYPWIISMILQEPETALQEVS